MRLFISLVLLAMLAACSPPKQTVMPTARLTAVGGSDGSGAWIVSWEAEGDSVELNGVEVESSGEQLHVAQAGKVLSFELRASSGSLVVTETVSIAGLSDLLITDEGGRSGPFELAPGESLQLQAVVVADGASQLPNQVVTWHSSDPAVMSVSEAGLVTSHGFGAADIYATSRQWTGRYDYVQAVSSTVPVIEHFTAEPVLDSADVQWRISWSTSAETAELDGTTVATSGSLELAVAGLQTVTLTARNSPSASLSTSIELAPVTALSLTEPDEPIVLGSGESRLLTVDVQAPGSDHPPAMEVTWTSSDPDAVTVDSEGIVTAIRDGSAVLTVRSRQYQQVSADIHVTVQTPGVYDLSISGGLDALEAGETLTLSWRAVALSSLSLQTWSGAELISTALLDPGQETADTVVPGNLPKVSYLLSWTADGGTSGNSRFWADDHAILGWVCDRHDMIVSFPDPQIEVSVRELYSVPQEAEITCGDVQRKFPAQLNEYGQETGNMIHLNRCEADVPKVTSLEGLQHLIHLARLELTCNDITDISRLASMTGLVEINLDDNRIEDISPLAGLTRLQVLGLYNNRVRHIDALSGLHELQILYLSENRVTDISALADLDDLRHVWLYYNCAGPDGTDCLADLSALSGKEQLESLVFHVNEVSDLSFIGHDMTKLKLVIASGNRITDLSPLQHLPELQTVAIDDNLVSSLQPLVDNTHFGSHSAYRWQRGYIQMPPEGHSLNGVHLAMGYNCLDPRAEPARTQLDEIRNRGAMITGTDADIRHCGSGFRTLSVPESREHLLESWRQSR